MLTCDFAADTFIQSLDASPSNHSMLVITSDPDICYGISLLRLRGYRAFILSPPNGHSNLSQFQPEGEFDKSVLRDNTTPLAFNGEPPRINGRAHRPSVMVPPSMFPFNGEPFPDPINILPTSTLRPNGDSFSGLKPPSASPGKPPVISPGVRSIRSQSLTSSSSSSSSKSGEGQVFRTPKAHVEEENESEDYVSVSPPKDQAKTSTRDQIQYHDTPSTSHSSTTPFNRRADFYVVPTTPSSPVSRNRFPLPDLNGTNASFSLRSNGAQTPALLEPPVIEKVASSASTIKAGPANGPFPQVKPPTLQIPPAIPDLKHPSPMKPTLPSFFPPAPPSPNRTQSVPPNHRLPISPPITSGSTTSVNGTSTAASGKTTPSPFAFGAFVPAARSTPNPTAQASFFSKPNINLPSAPTPKFVPPQVKDAGVLKATAPTFKPTTPAPRSLSATPAVSAPPAPGPKPIASHFKPLVDMMKVLHAQGQSTIYRSDLGVQLKKQHPTLYAQAGFADANKPFKRYMDAAADAGIVLRDGNEYVSLHSQYR